MQQVDRGRAQSAPFSAVARCVGYRSPVSQERMPKPAHRGNRPEPLPAPAPGSQAALGTADAGTVAPDPSPAPGPTRLTVAGTPGRGCGWGSPGDRCGCPPGHHYSAAGPAPAWAPASPPADSRTDVQCQRQAARGRHSPAGNQVEGLVKSKWLTVPPRSAYCTEHLLCARHKCLPWRSSRPGGRD